MSMNQISVKMSYFKNPLFFGTSFEQTLMSLRIQNVRQTKQVNENNKI